MLQFFNAGHVLGAAMVLMDIARVRILYTGDYSCEDDRHLMAAEIPRGVNIDVLIVVSELYLCRAAASVSVTHGCTIHWRGSYGNLRVTMPFLNVQPGKRAHMAVVASWVFRRLCRHGRHT